jgi:hypothetical protein
LASVEKLKSESYQLSSLLTTYHVTFLISPGFSFG